MLMNCDQYYELKQEIIDGIYYLIDHELWCFMYQGNLEYTVWYNPVTHRVSSCPEDTTFIKIEGTLDIAKARKEDGIESYFDTLFAYAQDNFNRRIDFGLLPGNEMYTVELNEYEGDRPKNFQRMVSEMASQCMNEFLEHNQVKIVVGSDNVEPDNVQAILEDRRKQYAQKFTLNISASTLGDNQNYSDAVSSEEMNTNKTKLTLNLNDDLSFQDLVKRVEKLESLVNSMTSLLKDWPNFL